MKRKIVLPLSIAVLSLAFFASKEMQAKAPKNPPVSPSAEAAGLETGAARMVPARAGLVKPIDSKKIQAGQQFEAVLNSKVQLKNGPELPRGTVLIGTAATGDSQTGGSSKLILRFTQAKLKDGKIIPVKATIVGLFPASSLESEDKELWNPKCLRVDQAVDSYGVQLHSNIADSDSGVFVSTKGNAVKLSLGSWIALAIEAQPDGQQKTGAPNGAA